MKNLEAIIPIIEKDFSKLPYVIGGLLEHTSIKHFHVITPEPSFLTVPNLEANITVHKDTDVFSFDKTRFPYKPNWIYQQFLKLFQKVTQNKWYVVCDADLYVNKRLYFFKDKAIPYLFYSNRTNKLMGSYAEFNTVLLGKYPALKRSPMNNIAIYNQDVVDDMLTYLGADAQKLAEQVASIIKPGLVPAEVELYIAWFMKNKENYSFDYKSRTLVVKHVGKYGPYIFSKKEIEDTLTEYKKADVIAIHSWNNVKRDGPKN